MENDREFDHLFVEQAAREFIDRYGQDAPEILQECAAVARENGDGMSADVWQEMATATKLLMEQDGLNLNQ
jgi:hypothetical protein